tara:strand:+ start:44 stop:2110 length:2067 start_codon:yes stop_codon:yes gene_type:complete
MLNGVLLSALYIVIICACAALLVALIRTRDRNLQIKDKLQHAEELAVVQERLANAQRMARIGNWEWDLVSNEPWWSEEVFRLFQIDPESTEPRYEALMNRIHPDDRAGVTHAIQAVLDGRKLFEVEYRIVLPNGTERIVHGRAEATFDEEGEPLRMGGTIHDITERKKADEDFRHRAAFQSLLARLSSELVRAQPRDVGRLLDDGIKAVGKRYDLDMISLWWLAKSAKAWQPLHRWSRVDDGNANRELPQDEIPWIGSQLRDGQVVVVDDVDNIPEEASVDLEVFRQRGNQSFVIIPLLIEGILEGACAFVVTRDKRVWSEEMITELRLFAENWAGAIARTTAMAEIEQLKNKLQQENLYLREEVKLAHGFSNIVGEDPELKRSLEAVEKVAPTDVAVLILGETGTGKELIARSIHKLSGRHDKPLVSVNCPALPSTLIESELFGHEKGAFTGAEAQRHGRFELAQGGTLFLDEVGDLPLDLQAKLLRVLQTGEFERIGGSETIRADVRLIAATNRDLKQAVGDGTFRADLYYRINSFPIFMPPLRERKNDIPLLAEHFVHKHAKRLGKNIDAISAKMIVEFMGYEWPGNVRELESIIERALISAEDNKVLKLSDPLRSGAGRQESHIQAGADGGVDLQTIERAHIVSVLEQTKWKITGENGAAAILGMPPSTLRSKMKRQGIVRKDH